MRKHLASISITASAATLLLFLLFMVSCKKETEIVPDNQPPDYDGIATVITENYVNRLFIDLLGREALDAEMATEVAALESADLLPGLTRSARDQVDDEHRLPGGRQQLQEQIPHPAEFELYRARCLEGVSDEYIQGAIDSAQQNATADSLAGNTAGANESNLELQRLLALKRARWEYRDGLIGIDEVMRRMVFNSIYDQINMNSFNFINATFDNLLLRYPTQAEFDASYAMVDGNEAAVLFTQSGQNKSDYAHIITHTPEFYEGMVRWSYRTFLGREPSTFETYTAMADFQNDHDLQRVQRRILTTDEYANIQP